MLFVAPLMPFNYEDKHLAQIEQCTTDTSIDQWHARLKTSICVEGRHFKHTW